MERNESVWFEKSWITTAIAIVVALVGVQHLYQALIGMHGGGDPPPLVLEHWAVTVLAFVATYAIAKGTLWAPWALAIAGAAVAILIVSLGPLLRMDSTERSGLLFGAGAIAIFTAVGVWYLLRRIRR